MEQTVTAVEDMLLVMLDDVSDDCCSGAGELDGDDDRDNTTGVSPCGSLNGNNSTLISSNDNTPYSIRHELRLLRLNLTNMAKMNDQLKHRLEAKEATIRVLRDGGNPSVGGSVDPVRIAWFDVTALRSLEHSHLAQLRKDYAFITRRSDEILQAIDAEMALRSTSVVVVTTSTRTPVKESTDPCPDDTKQHVRSTVLRPYAFGSMLA